jgi:hypothetical protein
MKLLFVLFSPSSYYLFSLRSNILLTLLLSITLSLFYFFIIRDQILHHLMEQAKLCHFSVCVYKWKRGRQNHGSRKAYWTVDISVACYITGNRGIKEG